MKRFLILIITAMSIVLSAMAANPDFSSMEDEPGISFMQAKGDLLKSGLYFNQFYMPQDLLRDLDLMQIVYTNPGASDAIADKLRQQSRKVGKGMEQDLKSNTGNAYISIWGNRNKDGIYSRVLIGIGTCGQLLYILLEGNIRGSQLTTVIAQWL